MRTDNLIAQLSDNLPVAPRHAAMKRLCTALAIGGLVALGLLLAALGLRPDFVQASGTAPFWMKWMYALSLMWASVVVVRRLGDPDTRVGLAWLGVGAPIAIVAMMAVGELMAAPKMQRAGLVFGQTSLQCFAAIPLLALPVLLGLVWAFRRLAPTRLRLAGAASGILAGAAGASIYAFACPENSAAFMVIWYTAGILAAGALGALSGPRLLRW